MRRVRTCRMISCRGFRLAIAVALFALQLTAEDIRLAIAHVGPRQVEDTTQKAVVRDYSAAWVAMAEALENNNPRALDASFTGIARDQLAARIQDQKQTGLRTHISDRGHNLEAVFYSPDGSAMQLHDSVDVEIQVIEGSAVIHSEQTTLHYVVLMTVAEDRWKVRLLQSVPGF